MMSLVQRGEVTFMDDVRSTTGLLNLSDAARYLGIPQQTFHRWARGYEKGRPLLHVLDSGDVRQANVPFVAVVSTLTRTA